MLVHILLLIYISLVGMVAFRKGVTRKKNKLFLVLAFLGIFLVQSLRNESVGLDSYRYYYAFLTIKYDNFGRMVRSWEPLYVLLNRFVGIFTDNPQWIFVVNSLIIDCSIAVFIFYNTEEGKSFFWPVFFWMIFVTYVNTMNTVRQGLALAVNLNIYTILSREQTKKAYIKSFFLLIVGMLFHTMSIVCAIWAIPFIIKKDSKLFLIISGIIAIAVTIFSSQMIELVLNIFPKYMKYDDSIYLEGADIGGYYIGWSLLRSLFLLIVLVLPPYEKKKQEYLISLSFYMIITIGLYLLKSRIYIASRVVYYFDIFQIIFIPRVIDRIKQNRAVKTFMYLLGWGLYLYMLRTSAGSRGCVPYLFFWQ